MLQANERVLQVVIPTVPEDLDRPEEEVLNDSSPPQLRTQTLRSHLFQNEHRYLKRILEHFNGCGALSPPQQGGDSGWRPQPPLGDY